MKRNTQTDTVNYIEIVRKESSLVRIDEILEQRMRTFIKARRIRRFTSSR